MDSYIAVEPSQIDNLDKIYMDYFGYKTEGFFVDIGAFDGMLYSNTYCLAVAGWDGICYEPVQSSYEACIRNHTGHKVKTIQACIGNRNGTVELIVPQARTLATYSDYYPKTRYWVNDYYGAYKILSKIITLDDALRENKVEPNFDVLSLDVEGSETDVLNFFDVNYWKPKMAIVEAQEHHEAVELRNQAPFINEYFANAGYRKIYSDQINNIYVI